MKAVIKKTVVIFLTVVASFSVLICIAGYVNAGKSRSAIDAEKTSVSRAKADSDERTDTEDMIENVLKSVVGISSADALGASTENMGSGVIASADGYIITNRHVTGARPNRIRVTLSNGDVTEGKTVWSDATLDLAVVKIDGGVYIPPEMGSARPLRAGERVYAIGNPLGAQFERTVTEGIVSAVGRSISIDDVYMEDLIQTDASVNPGNSGGPLINKHGEVVGINTVKVTSAEGMGFAVPIDLCVPVIKRIQSVGEFKTPYLGISVYTKTAAKYFGKKQRFDSGLLVVSSDENGPAFASGIRSGDIVCSVGETEVNTMLDLRTALFERQPGETVEICFERDKTMRKVEIMLAQN